MDMSQFIIAKSDQLNGDDLIGGPITVTITAVRGNDSADQPVSVCFDGDEGKPFKPCKSMRRVMVAAWGLEASKYVGRRMTLFRDPDVQFGGMKLGGIRISHMSDIDDKLTVALQVTRGKKGLYTVQPLTDAPATSEPDKKPQMTAEEWAERYIGEVKDCETIEALMDLQNRSANALKKLEKDRPDLHELTTNAGTQRATQLQGAQQEFAE